MSDPYLSAQPSELSIEYLRRVQARVMDAPTGDWEVRLNEDGEPDGFGPFSFVEVLVHDDLVPGIEFCRHARRDVPALLGEISRLRAELRAWENGERSCIRG